MDCKDINQFLPDRKRRNPRRICNMATLKGVAMIKENFVERERKRERIFLGEEGKKNDIERGIYIYICMYV